MYVDRVRRLRLFETLRKRSTLPSYWSVQIHATRKQLTAHEREGEYVVKSEVLPPSLETKICHRFARLIKILKGHFHGFAHARARMTVIVS